MYYMQAIFKMYIVYGIIHIRFRTPWFDGNYSTIFMPNLGKSPCAASPKHFANSG